MVEYYAKLSVLYMEEYEMTTGLQQPQTVPVQMHQTHDLLVLAAPMPGLEPEDITITGGVSNVDMDGNNALYIKAIQVFISTFETLPQNETFLPF
jgi:HSP20 family molecular chaperone IbpA